MIVLSEHDARALVDLDDALASVEAALIALAGEGGGVFPVMQARGFGEGERFGVKSGWLREPRALGLKLGSYWASNRKIGRPSHGSTTVLIDPETGYPSGLVASAFLTNLRTAAADALACRALAYSDAARIALFGTGAQAYWEVAAIQRVRPIEEVRIVGRDRTGADQLGRRFADELGVRAVVSEGAVACRDATIVVTVTAARGAIVRSEWVAPGTHISAMGADGPGKTELEPALVARGRLFADHVGQSVTLGEFEAALQSGLIDERQITPLGAVLSGRVLGRRSGADVTIFDSSGVAVQDLTLAAMAIERAKSRGLGVDINL